VGPELADGDPEGGAVAVGPVLDVGTFDGPFEVVGTPDADGLLEGAADSTKVDGALLTLGTLLGAPLDEGRAV
jgi:hypothetical protein